MSLQSEKINELVAALVKADLKNPPKDKTANIVGAKGSRTYRYSDLATMIEHSRPSFGPTALWCLRPLDTTATKPSSLQC